jgi:hypothetical protein
MDIRITHVIELSPALMALLARSTGARFRRRVARAPAVGGAEHRPPQARPKPQPEEAAAGEAAEPVAEGHARRRRVAVVARASRLDQGQDQGRPVAHEGRRLAPRAQAGFPRRVAGGTTGTTSTGADPVLPPLRLRRSAGCRRATTRTNSPPSAPPPTRRTRPTRLRRLPSRPASGPTPTLGALCNQAAVKLGDPAPVKALIAAAVPEGRCRIRATFPTPGARRSRRRSRRRRGSNSPVNLYRLLTRRPQRVICGQPKKLLKTVAKGNLDMIELEHSPLGGSAAHRFMTCIASFLLQREEIQNGTFEDVPSEFAALGVAAHELGAVCLTEGREPYEFLSEEFNGYRAGWEAKSTSTRCTVYFNDCMKILDATASRPRELLIERTIHLPEIHPLFKGTVDFGVLSPTRLWLRDYKNGEGIGVAAPNNKQLLYYAALMIRENPHWQEIPRDMPVSLGIVPAEFLRDFRGSGRVGNHRRLCARLARSRAAAPHERVVALRRSKFSRTTITFPAIIASFAPCCFPA